MAKFISTGSLNLDLALRTGGIPRGCYVEITGSEASGKTMLCQHIIAEAQRLGDPCAWIDADRALDRACAARWGIDLEQLYVSQPDNAEQALGTIEALACSGAMAVIVLDSVTALVPQVELCADLGEFLEDDENPLEALVSQTLRRLAPHIRKSQTTILLTSQTRPRRGAIYHRLVKHPARLTLKLHAAVRLELKPIGLIQEQGEVSGSRIQIKVLKNKFAHDFQTAELVLMYNKGIVKTGEIFDQGLQSLVIERREPGYSFQGQPLGKGRQQAIEFLELNPSVTEEIERIIRQGLLHF